MSEKAATKKVSIACNTCRLKRKKCDGLDPCSFCVSSSSEPCSYSREPKRRGPPSGYLRHVEAKASVLETLLGLAISRSSELNSILLECVQCLSRESTAVTQDVWDAYKIHWSNSPAAATLDHITTKFAPYTPRTEDTAARALLPLANTEKASAPAAPAMPTPFSSKIPLPAPPSSSSNKISLPSQPHNRPTSPTLKPLHAPPQSSYLLGRESFERTQTNFKPTQSSASPPYWQQFNSPAPDFSFPEQVADILCSLPSPATSSHRTHNEVDEDASMLDATSIIMQDDLNSNYTGSYWRSADLSFPSPSSSPGMHSGIPLPTHTDIDLPPLHIISHLMDVYFSHIHTSFPILPSRKLLEKMLSLTSDSSTALFLSMCAYMGRLSPSLGSTSIFEGSGEAGKIASDLWYEQARNVLATSLLRKPSQLETVQSLLLLGLRDHGKGQESQAWLLFGIAIRMGQDLSLHRDDEDAPSRAIPYSEEEKTVRKNVWRITTSLDLFLALQLGRPPGISDGLKPATEKIAFSNASSSDATQLLSNASDLCRIMTRINFQLYLGHSCDVFSPDAPISATEASSSDPAIIARTKLNVLKSELTRWHHDFPQAFRISIGHHPPERDILEVNMWYQVAIILLYRPFSKDPVISASEIYLEAASTFNILLDKYRTAPPMSTPGNTLATITSPPSLTLANPRLIYLIFTVAIAHLSAFKLQQQREAGYYAGSRMALQTQLHLMNCLDALNVIGGTWELARRCCRTLDRFMELEGMKSGGGNDNSNNSGLKRKRSLMSGVQQADMSSRSGIGPTQWSEVVSATSNSSTPHAPELTRASSSSSNNGELPQNLIPWSNPFSMVDQTQEVPASGTMTPYMYDTDPFLSSGWMAEILESVEASSGGVQQGLWNSGPAEWSDGLWGSLGTTLPASSR